MLTDIQYALKQLKGVDLFAVDRKTRDRVLRAVDALERVESELTPNNRELVAIESNGHME